MKPSKQSKIIFYPDKIILLTILVLAFFLRLYKIDIPLADHHSWRQADTAAVARNYIKEDFDFFRPRIDNMTPLNRPNLPNPERYFMVEPPLYNSLVALGYSIFGVEITVARLVTVLFSLGSLIFLYLLVKNITRDRFLALAAAFFAAVLPYSVFYSRVVLPEPMMVFFSLGMLYFFYGWRENQRFAWWLASLVAISLALVLKTFPFFLAVPMFYLAWKKWGPGFIRQKKLIMLALLSLVPIVLWRLWITNFPEGIPPYDWLLNQGGIRFRPAFFRWIFAERIAKLILGYWLVPVFAIGLLIKPGKKEGWFFHWWLVAFLLYVTVFAAGNVTHDYYQIPIIPIVSYFLAKGLQGLLRPLAGFSRRIAYPLALVAITLGIGLSWFEVREFYNIQGGVDLAGQAVDELTPADALVLTGDSNDATLLYNTNRHGWTGGFASNFPNEPTTLERVRDMGASVFVTTKFEENSAFGQYMLRSYPVLQRTNQFIIFDITKKNIF